MMIGAQQTCNVVVTVVRRVIAVALVTLLPSQSQSQNQGTS